jgi:hypothetical protein
MTVLAGVPAPVRAHLVEEILGGLTGARSGVHLELHNGSDRRITVVRPREGDHRVDAPDDGVDLTDDYRNGIGRVDVLERYGIPPRAHGCVLHVDGAAAGAVTADDVQVARLGSLNQAELWSTANRVQVTEAEFQALSTQVDHGDDGTAAVARVEKRHHDLDEAIATRQETQRNLFRLGALALIGAVPVATMSSLSAMPLVAIAVGALALALVLRAKIAVAVRQEEAALASAGSDSYLGFVVRQVDGLMTGTELRRRLSAVAADHRESAIAWTRLAGNVTVDWAYTHQREIDAAARLRSHLGAMDTVSATAPEIDERTAAVAGLVLGRMTELRRIGYGAESFPLILDDPFTELDPSVRLGLLELIAREAGSPQVILLTDLDDVAGWARLEALSGRAALLEPLGPSAPAEPAEPARATADGTRSPGSTAEAGSGSDRREPGDSYGVEARGLAV